MKDLRVNARVQAKVLRVIDENGVSLGLFSFEHAMQLARGKSVDLVVDWTVKAQQS